MSRARAVLFCLWIVPVAGVLRAQQEVAANGPAKDTRASVTFQLDRPGIHIPRYSFEVHEDGTVLYHAEEVVAAAPNEPVETRPIDRRLQITHTTVDTIFKTARALDHFNLTCESTAKNIAKTGNKTLSYKGGDGTGQCTYNFSENKGVESLTELFQSLAYTQDEGRKLDFLHRFDRLGLDEETIALADAVANHSAIEIGTISASLQSLVDDTAVMQRVRQRAMTLLEQAKQAE
jgi:hypothetical protein